MQWCILSYACFDFINIFSEATHNLTTNSFPTFSSLHLEPAYLSVKSKKTKPLTTNALESKESSGVASNSEGWPQSLKDYVQRVFETIADEERDVAQRDLRDMVSKHHSDGTLWNIEWEKMTVPK